MILYFSGGTTSKLITEFMSANNCARLFSYYNDKKVIESKVCEDVFLDCGAWTAFTKHKVIDLETYKQYLEEHKDTYKVAASLDVIPHGDYKESAKLSYNNFIELRKYFGNSIQLLPTYHRGEPLEALIKLLTYEDEYGKLEYIGIGAVASNKSRIVRDTFLQTVFNTIKKYRPDIKTHLFGLTDLSLLDKYSIYSADSTTWLMAGAMGEIITDFGRIKISDKNLSLNGFKAFNTQERESLISYITKFGFTIEELQESSEKRQLFNVAYIKSKTDKIEWKNSKFIPKSKLF